MRIMCVLVLHSYVGETGMYVYDRHLERPTRLIGGTT